MSHANKKKVSLTGAGLHINETVVDSGLFHGDLATGKSRGESSSGLPGAQALAKIYVDHLVGDSSPTLKWKLLQSLSTHLPRQGSSLVINKSKRERSGCK